ncbi:universal stress protein [Anaerophaga thermohalophila]|uniref:universal stress protein n=1 Tax=Anaerophaga thermohalophila TaxID=177400 RepID=UPI000237CA50|nr:universal stress protein [Anaerophaga thermohalophila]
MINILVPVTFTDYSVNALTYALTLAGKFPSKITILHSFPEYEDLEEEAAPDMPNSEESIRRREQDARDRLTALCQATINKMTTLQDRNVELQNRFEFGYPEDVIIQVCKEMNSDVVIMGTKSKGETIKELLGSITADVMKRAESPVLAVPANSKVDLDKLSKVLFITDFSDSDYISIHKLVRLITPFHTEIHAIRFVNHKPDKAEIRKQEQFRDYCKATYRNHRMKFGFEKGEPFIPALEKYVGDNNIDLIAMTKRKRNMIAQLFSPEITRKILFHTDIPLLVFHP